MDRIFSLRGLTVLAQHAAVFLIIVATAKTGQYIYYGWDTSPAILWPPTGIAIAVMWLLGYTYAIPVFLALLLSGMTGPMGVSIYAFTGASGQVLGDIVAVFSLRRFGFDGSFSNSLSLLGGVVALTGASMIAPTITALTMEIAGFVVEPVHLSWSRSWAGHMLSALVIFPLIVSWVRPEPNIMWRSLGETMGLTVLTALAVYLIFWTSPTFEYAFLFFTLFFVAYFWIAFRFSTRALALSLAATTFFGMLGLFLSPVPGTSLNDQLFAAEIFLFLVIPTFYAISALVKERAKTIDKLKIAMEHSERESIAKNEFIAVLAHELRNPLAPIKSTLEIVGLEERDEETSQLVTRAQQQVRAMQRLLADLLDITRVTQGKFELKRSPVQICELIRQCIQSTQYVFKDREHTITMDPVCDDTLWLSVDPVRFEQVLVNILMNAAKYTDPGGEINIQARPRNAHVEIRVQDSGVGIEEEHLEDVFEAFWQHKKPDTKSLTGIGVGLWLTRRIVEMHGGTIHAESEGKGKGSTFVVRIPLLRVPPVEATQPETRSSPVSSYEVLVGDDNKAAADSLTKLLTLKGYGAIAAYSGEEVLAALSRAKPDIILLDIGLVDMSGYDVARELRKRGYGGMLIALSGYGQDEDKRKAREAGFDYHFTKPMSIEQFETYLRERK